MPALLVIKYGIGSDLQPPSHTPNQSHIRPLLNKEVLVRAERRVVGTAPFQNRPTNDFIAEKKLVYSTEVVSKNSVNHGVNIYSWYDDLHEAKIPPSNARLLSNTSLYDRGNAFTCQRLCDDSLLTKVMHKRLSAISGYDGVCFMSSCQLWRAIRRRSFDWRTA